jgi:hypothetical protein
VRLLVPRILHKASVKSRSQAGVSHA